jgi:pSer/pThr/pTyr-binding forkhead associated (FHA) protein
MQTMTDTARSMIVTTGPSASMLVHVADEPLTVGRSPRADIRLEDITVSLRHAEIRIAEGALVVIDLGSLNGTWVNGRSEVAKKLEVGDEVSIGRSTFRVLGPPAERVA